MPEKRGVHEYGIGPHQITVLARFSAQIRLLRDTISPDDVEVASIGEVLEWDSIECTIIKKVFRDLLIRVWLYNLSASVQGLDCGEGS